MAGVFSSPPPPVEVAPPPAPLPPTPPVEAPIEPAAPATEPAPTLATVEASVSSPEAPPLAPPEPSPVVESSLPHAPVEQASMAEPEEVPGSSPAEEGTVALPPLPAPGLDPTASVAAAYGAQAAPSADGELSAQLASPPFVPGPRIPSSALSASLPPPARIPALADTSLSGRLSAARARFIESIPPPWLELARRQPVLWMVVIPVALATLLILLAVALSPDVETARPEPLAPATTSAGTPTPSDATGEAPPTAPAGSEPDGARMARLESKSPDTLSVDEVLAIKQHRAELKRKDADGLARKLLQEPELAKDAAVQRELWRLVQDPDTSVLALGALARAPSPVAKDLLYEAWTSRTLPAATTELAGSFLSSRDARASASPALAVALELRRAETCEAISAALPQARSDGDRRALPSLGKLASRRGCGADKSEDCYPCLRTDMKRVNATIDAVKRKKPPTYGSN